MLLLKYFLQLIYFQLIFSDLRINLYYTNETDERIPHDCFRFVSTSGAAGTTQYEIKYYCLSELPFQWNIEHDNISSKFTFNKLEEKNITSEQLHSWSASIDIIEEYQLFLNQSNVTNNWSVYWNCTQLRFGPQCEYEFYQSTTAYASFDALIESFYTDYSFVDTNLTCYIDLQCTRNSIPFCLQWSQICDGQIQCLDNGNDEKDCWQLVINECQENEYRCRNGQCIPKEFSQMSALTAADCIDGTDAKTTQNVLNVVKLCSRYDMPSFKCDDLACEHIPLSNLCLKMSTTTSVNPIFFTKNKTVFESCRLAIQCIISILHSSSNDCDKKKFCSNYSCIQIINETCPDHIFFGLETDSLGDMHFMFQKNDIDHISADNVGLFYLCYKNAFFNQFFPLNSYMMFNDSICLFNETLTYRRNTTKTEPIYKLYDKIRRFHMIIDETLNFICNQSNMYRCQNSSKCISIYRINDGLNDCPYIDDENMTDIHDVNIINRLEKVFYKCHASNKYIHHRLLGDRQCDCGYIENNKCEDEDSQVIPIRKHISFQTICDGFQELVPRLIDGENHTDETECQQWECDNLYTRCDKVWNCPNGKDETGCLSRYSLNCSQKYHYCVSFKTNQLTCLPIEQINDGNVDCLGGTDEPSLCRKLNGNTYESSFYCNNRCIDPSNLCDGKNQCLNGEDEQFCVRNRTSNSLCSYDGQNTESDSEIFLCRQFASVSKKSAVPFLYYKMLPLINNPTANTINSVQRPIINKYDLRCHRGIDLLVWLDFQKKISSRTCFCPLSFYGSHCQYQRQRVTLSVAFRALSDSWQTVFAIVITLVDDTPQRTIHSYEQITFLWHMNCKTKFHFYLLYSTRPKDPTAKNYSVQIDFYEKDSLKYRGSSLYPIQFSFLPVYRLSLLVDIPRTNNKNQSCSNRKCLHGQCIRYYNHSQDQTFCHCNEGWSGDDCSIQHTCRCSSQSHCIGILPNNRSICVCRNNYFGSRCFLSNTICENQENSTCLNGGRCIAKTDILFIQKQFFCLCPDGYMGDRCQNEGYRLNLSFSKDLLFSPLMYIHFICLDNGIGVKLLRTTTIFRTLRSDQDSLSIMSSHLFHLMTIEFSNKNYYLTILRKDQDANITYNKTISSSDHCPNISKFFNETFIRLPLIRRIKYYHLLCENILCFHDEIHFCLCYSFNGQRLANCFEFNHNMTFDCDGRSECENDGQCFQDDKECPKRSICLCQACFYGRRCQFSTSGFGLSLDAIIGYQIEPDLSFNQQPAIIKLTLALTILFVLAGLIDGFLSLITFKNKSIRNVGCGIYLLCSSITTLILSIILLLKFSILLNTQMKNISNRIFLEIQCYSLDFLIRICLQLDQWLTTCVAVERTFTVMRETRFDKRKSRQSAKYVILCLLILLICSSIQDPLYRRLIDERNDDNDEIKRIWCIVTYSSKFLRQFNSYMHTFHFLVPFTINFLSAILLITFKSRQQLRIQKNHSYKQILRQQYQQHKNLLIAPIVSILLGLSRLILTFTSRCMQSSDDAWLYIILYFISFIPSMLTFIIFVLSSKFYLKEFNKSIIQYRMAIQRHLHLQ